MLGYLFTTKCSESEFGIPTSSVQTCLKHATTLCDPIATACASVDRCTERSAKMIQHVFWLEYLQPIFQPAQPPSWGFGILTFSLLLWLLGQAGLIDACWPTAVFGLVESALNSTTLSAVVLSFKLHLITNILNYFFKC